MGINTEKEKKMTVRTVINARNTPTAGKKIIFNNKILPVKDYFESFINKLLSLLKY